MLNTSGSRARAWIQNQCVTHLRSWSSCWSTTAGSTDVHRRYITSPTPSPAPAHCQSQTPTCRPPTPDHPASRVSTVDITVCERSQLVYIYSSVTAGILTVLTHLENKSTSLICFIIITSTLGVSDQLVSIQHGIKYLSRNFEAPAHIDLHSRGYTQIRDFK